jgi:hypothetical protein
VLLITTTTYNQLGGCFPWHMKKMRAHTHTHKGSCSAARCVVAYGRGNIQQCGRCLGGSRNALRDVEKQRQREIDAPHGKGGRRRETVTAAAARRLLNYFLAQTYSLRLSAAGGPLFIVFVAAFAAVGAVKCIGPPTATTTPCEVTQRTFSASFQTSYSGHH